MICHQGRGRGQRPKFKVNSCHCVEGQNQRALESWQAVQIKSTRSWNSFFSKLYSLFKDSAAAPRMLVPKSLVLFYYRSSWCSVLDRIHSMYCIMSRPCVLYVFRAETRLNANTFGVTWPPYILFIMSKQPWMTTITLSNCIIIASQCLNINCFFFSWTPLLAAWSYHSKRQ